MRFDAYAGNVWERNPHEVATAIAWGVKGRVEQGKPRGRYGEVFEVHDGGQAVGWVGRDNVLDSAFFEFKGVRTPDAAQAIRKHFASPGHNVARVDVCEDYSEPGAFEQLVAAVDRSKGDPRVHSEAITPRDGDRGSTIYWGSRKSAALVRCYEKGKQRENLHLRRPHWARVELQMRPAKSAHKQLAAQLEPLCVWGLGGWTWNVAQHLTGMDLQRYALPQVAPQFDRTTLYVARTFRRHFEAMLGDLGDWECVGRELAAVWEQDDQAGSGEAPGE